MFFWLFIISKLMGQREVARLTLFDFLVSITIGGLVSGPLFIPKVGLKGPIINIAFLGLLNMTLAYLSLKHSKIRRVFQDEPFVLIENGIILEEMMGKTRFNLDDLLTELRLKNVANIADVEFAILESSGTLSVILKSQARPLTPKDLKLETDYEGMPIVLIEDGNVLEDNLQKNNLNQAWLISELENQGTKGLDNVMAAILDTKGRLYVSKKKHT